MKKKMKVRIIKNNHGMGFEITQERIDVVKKALENFGMQV